MILEEACYSLKLECALRDLGFVDIDPEGFYQGRKTVADMLIESRQKLEEYGRQLKKIQSQNSEEIN